MKKKGLLKKTLIIAASVLLTVVIAASAVMFWHYPHYAAEKAAIETVQQDNIRLMSCNLRCLTPLDLGKKSWFWRADMIMEDIGEQAPGIIGFQEATRWQYNYLVDTMPQYDSVITYRDNTAASEGCPIFYRTDCYTLVDKGSFWLSETPDVMSKDWGSACYRICSYVILTDNATGKNFVVFNTHLDHVSDEARIKGIDVVLGKIQDFGSLPAIIMGDLNAEEGSETYTSVTANFIDARYAAADTTGEGTYQNWGKLENRRRIDYFMVSKSGFEILSYQVIDNEHDGIYASDHCPIVLEVEMSE